MDEAGSSHGVYLEKVVGGDTHHGAGTSNTARDMGLRQAQPPSTVIEPIEMIIELVEMVIEPVEMVIELVEMVSELVEMVNKLVEMPYEFSKMNIGNETITSFINTTIHQHNHSTIEPFNNITCLK